MTRVTARTPPVIPEAAANPAAIHPARLPTAPRTATLCRGHLTAECAAQGGGAPACPACLRDRLAKTAARD